MIVFPNAKINLGLQVIGKLPNGYHSIQSILYPIPVYDVLEFVPSKAQTHFQSSGLEIPNDGKENLVLRAYQLMKKDFQLPEIDIFLFKQIPMGAGLGGGSSDAAFMLKALSEHFELFLEDSFLKSYAEQLGSDCPFFIANTAALATGTGTDLTPITVDLKGLYLLLIHPGIHISTQEAYSGVIAKAPRYDLREVVTKQRPADWRKTLHNDFEDSVFILHPELKKLKEQFYAQGAVYAAMSGSGSTLFALFEGEPPKAFENQLKAEYVTFRAHF